jgi:hypothetical protein
LFQQSKVIIARQARRFQIVPNYENGNLAVCRNHNRPADAWLCVRPVTPFLTQESKAGGKEDPLQSSPIHWSEFWHEEITA